LVIEYYLYKGKTHFKQELAKKHYNNLSYLPVYSGYESGTTAHARRISPIKVPNEEHHIHHGRKENGES
jgi:hypothetical protein